MNKFYPCLETTTRNINCSAQLRFKGTDPGGQTGCSRLLHPLSLYQHV